MAEWQTQQTQNLPTINRVGSSPTARTKRSYPIALLQTSPRGDAPAELVAQ